MTTFYNLLSHFNIINPLWFHILELIENEIKDEDDKDINLNLFSIYFSLIDDGNCCISLNEKKLYDKWKMKLDGIDTSNMNSSDKNRYDELYSSLNIIKDTNLKNLEKSNVISRSVNDKTIFITENDYLYLRKYYLAKKGIKESIDRLFNVKFDNNIVIDFNSYLDKNHQLSNGQSEVISKGLNNNLVVTGGPGTGKTTSVLYVLLSILANDDDYNIYLAAAAGKAAGRMKDSLKDGINGLLKNNNFDKEPKLKKAMDIISGILSDDHKVEEFTIHRLLSVDVNTKRFKYNKTNQFPDNSIFVIDEASMIDLCLFNNLLASIPTGARVFILGDKNQLPSVDVGAVFSELLDYLTLDKKAEIKENQRFKSDSEVNILAEIIRNQQNVNLTDTDFRDSKAFKIEEVVEKEFPVFYYKLDGNSSLQKESINIVLKKWKDHFFKNIVSETKDLDKDNITEKELKDLFNKYTFLSKIISAENDGIRGVNTINCSLKKMIYTTEVVKSIKDTAISNNYVGQLMMVNKNNRSLDLYNGDIGMLVTFKNDKTLYFMINKKTSLDLSGNRETDKIFKIGDYVFYPFRLITLSDIDLAYAITVHKSQGSDYQSILVILPTNLTNPLLNNQIVYTAITRTKGNTYVLSNLDCLKKAISYKLERDTNIC